MFRKKRAVLQDYINFLGCCLFILYMAYNEIINSNILVVGLVILMMEILASSLISLFIKIKHLDKTEDNNDIISSRPKNKRQNKGD